jgi:molybdenum cofactor biosynthesis enzyme MoaA
VEENDENSLGTYRGRDKYAKRSEAGNRKPDSVGSEKFLNVTTNYRHYWLEEWRGSIRRLALSCEAEPTMHPHFVDVMNIIAEKTNRGADLPVGTATNGTLMSGRKMDAMFDAGIFRIAISIDGFAPETFSRLRKNGEISKVFEKIDEITRRKAALGRGGTDSPRLQINFTLMKSTLHELLPLIEHARRWQVENFTVTHVYSTDTRDMSHESLADQPEAAMQCSSKPSGNAAKTG